MDFSLIIISIAAFISTNIDDLFLLMFFFSRSDYNDLNIVIGQYLGIIFLLMISMLAYFFKFVIPNNYLSILGIIPIVIGLKKLYELKKQKSLEFPEKSVNSNFMGVISVAGVTISNGGDNIGVYMPLFASFNLEAILIFLSTFMILTGLWCALSHYMVNKHVLGTKISKYGHMIFPFVLIFIGIYIIFL
jgi:cadmium resistance protein CadD (predicted permease)